MEHALFLMRAKTPTFSPALGVQDRPNLIGVDGIATGDSSLGSLASALETTFSLDGSLNLIVRDALALHAPTL
jgi:hypothetical protein